MPHLHACISLLFSVTPFLSDLYLSAFSRFIASLSTVEDMRAYMRDCKINYKLLII